MQMNSIDVVAEKIRSMEIRGAGRIARAAASALKEHALTLTTENLREFNEEMRRAATLLANTRPTAISLPNAIHHVMNYTGKNVEEARENLVKRADEFVQRSQEAMRLIGEIGARRIQDGYKIMTHCNSEAALSIITTAYRQGKDIEVFATESRPFLQGHITIAQLNDAGIPTNLIVDSAVRFFMKKIDVVVVGADAITVNGSLINKIGTSQLALIAHEARKNFIVAAETYKFNPKTLTGELVEIEERSTEEVLPPEKQRALPHVHIRNPVFDVTPREYIDLICTEVGGFPPEMAYVIIKDFLGWPLEELSRHQS
jgi:ribose 1,5-bisphosphate isomerase